VRESPSIGVHIRRQLLFVTRWLLPNCVHGLVQDEWQGAQLVSDSLCVVSLHRRVRTAV